MSIDRNKYCSNWYNRAPLVKSDLEDANSSVKTRVIKIVIMVIQVAIAVLLSS